ncbi:MAG: GTP cyclohydrolase [Veillonellaceae bacterium]|nr:GTP cyclohydrolase [Veillonellaceae bacterium]
MRKIRIGIVGPGDSVALIVEVAREYQDRMVATGYIYEDASEVPEIVLANDNDVDMWIFSGKVPYRYALAGKRSVKPKLFMPHTGTSIYRVLLYLAKAQIPIGGMSFDTFSRQEIVETFEDAETPLPTIYVNDYDGVVSASELTRFHLELWQAGRTKIAVTCFFATYQELRRQGVMAFRIWPTKNNIRTILDLAVSKADAILSKAGQIAIQHIAIDDYDEFRRSAASGYSVQKVELQLYEILLQYAEKIQGSLAMQGNGRYILYSTRGAIEEFTCGFSQMPVIAEVGKRLSISASGGIGFGDTAYGADENANIALGLAKRKGKNHWMVILDDKTVVGPLNSDLQIAYSIRSETLDGLALAKKLNISGTTLNKLLSVFAKIEGEAIGAETLAQHLSMTERSARRLLGTLVQHGMALETGEEYRGAGRPRKMYRVDVKKIMA